MKRTNIISLKFNYTCTENLLPYIQQYNTLLKCTYNKLVKGPLSSHDLNEFQKTVKHCDLLSTNCWYRDATGREAKSMLTIHPEGKAIFGGKQLFLKRCNHKISREEFQMKKLVPLYSVGEANVGGNRLFKILDEHSILFRSDRNHEFVLQLGKMSKKRANLLKQLMLLQNAKQIPLTYKLTTSDVIIRFDYNMIHQFQYTVKQNRILALDLNPSSIGWSVVDWKSETNYHVVQAGTFSLKSLNDHRDSLSVSSASSLSKHLTNKRKFEIIHVAQQLFDLCKYYHCEVLAIEKLRMPIENNNIGRRFNRQVNNQWSRHILVAQLKKRINASSSVFIECIPDYSSYIGNILYRKEQLPDECLASIEIGRRGWEFATQYTFNRRLRSKTVVFPSLDLVKNELSISLEEIGAHVPELKEWKNICQEVKKSKCKYRFSTETAQRVHASSLFSKFYKRRYLRICCYL